MNKKINILSTATLKKETLAILANHAVSLIERKFIKIIPLVNETVAEAISAGDEHVIFTSKNAVRSYKKNIKKAKLTVQPKRVYCLDGATKKAVQKIKHLSITATADNGAALAGKMVNSHSIFSASFFCGNIRRNELVQKLQENLISVKETVLYETLLTPRQIKKAYDAVLFFSPSAVRSFFAVNLPAPHIPCFCVGATTADEAKKFTSNLIITAEKPSQKSVVKAAIKYFIK